MHPTTLPTVDPATLDVDEVLLLDVRELPEWQSGHAPTAVHLPMSEIAERVDEVPRDRTVACICRSGNRSAQVTAWLLAQGYDARNLVGGMQRWAAAGRPVVAGSPTASAR
jgi:rhodanese-related sulfurtransferase